MVFIISKFIDQFGHDYFFSPKRWKTRDGVIPFRHFFLMLRALDHLNAAQQLQDGFATAHGVAMVWDGKDSKVRSHTRRLVSDANPEAL